jgi:hypothetical protein
MARIAPTGDLCSSDEGFRVARERYVTLMVMCMSGAWIEQMIL